MPWMRTILIAGLLAIASPASAEPRRIGGDVDRHGCRASAGYSWCARTKRCERPWELARQEGFTSSAKAFRRFCRVRPRR